jgi:hypothetical protein
VKGEQQDQCTKLAILSSGHHERKKIVLMKTGSYKRENTEKLVERKMVSFGPCISERLEMLLDKLS